MNNSKPEFLIQIEELLKSNGWSHQFILEVVSTTPGATRVEIRLSKEHAVAPLDIVNCYEEALHPLEQVQQECLRALRTGRPGS